MQKFLVVYKYEYWSTEVNQAIIGWGHTFTDKLKDAKYRALNKLVTAQNEMKKKLLHLWTCNWRKQNDEPILFEGQPFPVPEIVTQLVESTRATYIKETKKQGNTKPRTKPEVKETEEYSPPYTLVRLS